MNRQDLNRREVLISLAIGSMAMRRSFAATGKLRLAPADAFALDRVRLLDGSFKTAQSLDARYLLSLSADRLLHNFRVNAGLKPNAAVYGGWESQEPWVEIRCHGHTLGHYLSACSMMFAATGDTAFKTRADYLVAQLRECQQAGGGIVTAFPDGAAPLLNSLSNQPFAGVPWYTMHKLLAGLRDAKWYAQNDAAVLVMRGVGDWIDVHAAALSEADMQTMLEREHGGMVEVLADLYAMTDDRRYLALAKRFVHHAFIAPLMAGRDPLDGLHSNTQIPKIIGIARLHELEPNPDYARAAQFFWETVVMQRSFATGGNGDLEHFFPVKDFPAHLQSPKTMETCCAHNMLRLTRALYRDSPDVAYADYYERTAFNAIVGSQDPRSGMMTYFQPTKPNYVKLYCTPTDSFWCCTGSGMENHAKYGDSIYFHTGDTLYVNLFIASELDWREQRVRVTQTTRFPDESATRLSFDVARSTRFRLRVRHPVWCQRVEMSINGKPLTTSTRAGDWIDIERRWRKGDVLDVALPMTLHLERLPHAPEFAALMYGPVVLAGRLGEAGLTPGADIIVNERASGETLNIPMEIPTLNVTSAALVARVKRIDQPQLAFVTDAAPGRPQLDLIPYHRIAHERYNLYWRVPSDPG